MVVSVVKSVSWWVCDQLVSILKQCMNLCIIKSNCCYHVARGYRHTSPPIYCIPCSAIGTYLSPICNNTIVLSTCDLFTVSLWHGLHRCTTLPSSPCVGYQPDQTFFPPLFRHSSFGHCTSILRPKFTLS